MLVMVKVELSYRAVMTSCAWISFLLLEQDILQSLFIFNFGFSFPFKSDFYFPGASFASELLPLKNIDILRVKKPHKIFQMLFFLDWKASYREMV